MNLSEPRLRDYMSTEADDLLGSPVLLDFDLGGLIARARGRRRLMICGAAGAVLVLMAAVGVGIYLSHFQRDPAPVTGSRGVVSSPATKRIHFNQTTCEVPANANTSLLREANMYFEPLPAGMRVAISAAQASKIAVDTNYVEPGTFSLQVALLTDTTGGLPGYCGKSDILPHYRLPAWIVTTPYRPTDPQSLFLPTPLPPGTVLAPEHDIVLIDANTGKVLSLATVS